MKITTRFLFSSFFLLLFLGFSFASSGADFSSAMVTQKDQVLSLYDATYDAVYKQFQHSGLSLVKSLNYQSLVCLGVLNNASFLQEMQNDITALKLSFLNKYALISSSYSDLGQKQRIYEDSNVSLFASGSYAKDLAVLSGKYSQILSEESQHAAAFQQLYQQKLVKFINDFNGYVTKNTQLLSTVSAKLTLLQSVDTRFQELSSVLDTYHLRIAGQNPKLFSIIPYLRDSLFSGLETSLQTTISNESRKYRMLPNFSGFLISSKDSIVSGFIIDFTNEYNLLLSSWYDNTTYTSIQNKVKQLHSSYVSGSVYQCSSLLINTNLEKEVSSLINQIANFSGSLSTGVVVSSSGFQNQILSLFSRSQTKQKTELTKFKTYIRTTAQKMISDLKQNSSDITGDESNSSPVIDLPSTQTIVSDLPSQDDTQILPGFIAPASFIFTQAFKKNQVHSDILILQKLLHSLSYYTGSFSTTYTNNTITALYHFQLDRGLLKGYERKPAVRGWMGPSTRSALNKILKDELIGL